MALCAFCGKAFSGKTKDHIPPRGLFGPAPTGIDLITVPSCPKCNNDTSRDDEYFRLIAMDIDASENPTAQQVNDSVLRAMFHPMKKGFRNSVFRSLRPAQLTSPGGLWLGNTFSMKLDMPRLLRTVEKTIRGLFYTIRKHPVPGGYRVGCHATHVAERILPDPSTSPIHTVLLPWLQSEPVREVGPKGVFRYRWVSHEEDQNTMFLVLGFFGKFDFLGFVHRPDGSDEIPNTPGGLV